MAYRVSSPALLRSSSGVVPESPIPRANKSTGIGDCIVIQDDEELHKSTKSRYFTQPTRNRNTPSHQPRLARSVLSSPVSVVEVPASSPFMPQASVPQSRGTFAALMAPTGTSFRPPGGTPAEVPKRGAQETIPISDDELNQSDLVDDSSDNAEPSRAVIRPAAFTKRAPVSRSTKKPFFSDDLSRSTTLVTSPVVRTDSYAASGTGVMEAIVIYSDSDSEGVTIRPQVKIPRRRLVQGRLPQPRPSSPAELVPLPEKPKLANVSRPKKRLVQRPIVELSDDGDNFVQSRRQMGSRSSPVNDDESCQEDRILNYLNTCTVPQLVAIAKVKKDVAEAMLKHKPFESIGSAEKITMASERKSRKKAARLSIGEDILYALKEYTKALDSIDHVISICEDQAVAIKSATCRWKSLPTGKSRVKSVGDDGAPPTPTDSDRSLISLPVPQPKLMAGHCTMKDFQVYGLNWLWLLYENQYGGILADDMGLGKTCQVISLMCTVVEDWESYGQARGTRPWPNLILVPPSTLANWKAEFQKFAPRLAVTIYQGTQDERDKIAYTVQRRAEDHHVLLSSYSQISRPEDIRNLQDIRPTIAIFDEGHKLKNPKAKIYRDLIRLPASWRLILSGTPVQNNIMEMVALLRFVAPELFKNHFEDLEALFNQKVSLDAVSEGALLHSDRVSRARTILEPFILQRKKEQVLQDLPPKTSRVMLCDMDEEQRTLYEQYERRFRKLDTSVVAKAGGRDNDNNNVWLQLRKAAIHPQLFRRYFSDKVVEKMGDALMRHESQAELRQPNKIHLVNELKALSDFELHLWCRDYHRSIGRYDVPKGSWLCSGKVQELLGLIRTYRQNGDRALVFTRWAKVIEILTECFESEGIKSVCIQGNTEVKERQELVNEFNDDPSIPVFLLTTGSGGTGINLTAANKVIIFDQSDNPQDDKQAEDRAHRLGQTRSVEVIRLLSKGTVEELVYKACQKKLELANKVTGWGTAEMTEKELEAVVRAELGLTTPPSGD